MQKAQVPGVQATLAAALEQHRAGRLEEAEQLYHKVLRAAPAHADALHFYGLLAHQTGRHDLAVQLIGKAIAKNAGVPAYHHNRGVVLAEQHRYQEAVGSFRRAVALNPQFVSAHFSLGAGLQAQRILDEAALCYARVIALQPDYAAAYVNLGTIRCDQGRLEDAATLYEQALTHDPTNAEAHNGLGNSLRQQGKVDAALASYRRALQLEPNFVAAHDNLGMLLVEEGSPGEALNHFDCALTHAPTHAPAHGHRGNALKELGRPAEAVASFRRALSLAPNDPDARLGLAIATIPLLADSAAESDSAVDAFARSLEDLESWSAMHPGLLGNSVGRNLPFYLAYRPGDVGGPLARYGNLMSAAAALQWPEAALIARSPRPTGERLRLTIVSGHVRRHPVWDIVLRGMLAHLDRRRIHITLYHTGSSTDDETLWAAAQVERWVAGPRSMQAWLSEVARDLPDVLFYPEVGMDPVTYALAALRLAPVQIAGWGHPVTTGLPTMDIFLSADRLEAVGAESHYRETLARLPGTGVCTSMPAGRAARWEGASRPPLTVRFALCQQPIKFDPADDALIARIAKAVGPSEFWLASPRTQNWAHVRLQARLATAFRAAGLDPGKHLRVIPWLPPDRFLGFLDEMDIYLDCPGFSGYTTAWQAVHRGLPIVTCEGPYLRQRLAGGLLQQLGLEQGIASTRDQYVEIAVRLAQEQRSDPVAWTARRATIRNAAPLADDNREAVRMFEQILLQSKSAVT